MAFSISTAQKVYLQSTELTSAHIVQNYNSLKGHKGAVNALSMASNGLLVSGSEDTTVKVWDLSDEKKQDYLFSLDASAGRVFSLTALSDNEMLSGHAEGTNEGTVMRWDLNSRTGSLLGKHPSYVYALASDSVNKLAFSGGTGIREWNLSSGDVKSFPLNEVRSFAILPSENALFSCFPSQNTILKWDYAGNCKEFGNHDGVMTLGISPDGTLLVSGASTTQHHASIKIWNAHTGQFLHELKGHTDTIMAFAFLSDKILVSGSLDKSLRFWNPVTGEWLDTIENAHSNGIKSLAATGNILASGANENDIKLWKKTN